MEGNNNTSVHYENGINIFFYIPANEGGGCGASFITFLLTLTHLVGKTLEVPSFNKLNGSKY